MLLKFNCHSDRIYPFIQYLIPLPFSWLRRWESVHSEPVSSQSQSHIVVGVFPLTESVEVRVFVKNGAIFVTTFAHLSAMITV